MLQVRSPFACVAYIQCNVTRVVMDGDGGHCADTHTCFQRVEGGLQDNFNIIAVTSFLQCIYLTLVTLCTVVLYKWVQRNPSAAKRRNNKKNKSFNEGVKFEFDPNDDDYFR